MNKIKQELEKHYKKALIIIMISCLKGILVETPATVSQLFTWVFLSVLIAVIGGDFKEIKARFNDYVKLSNKIVENRTEN